ncbi:TPT-domain-containing protein, partial [Martensiomyces pterosporus]
EFRKHILLSMSFIVLWYTFSGMLSVYNKWLFGKSERDFPFPLFVSSIHMLAQYLLALLCLRMFPSMRPTQSPTWGAYLTRAVPCGIATALDVGLSNISLRTITLTFYTMCKSSSLGFVLVFAFLFGLERVRLVLVAIIAIISVGVVLMVAGEVDFILSGFIEAITSSAMSGLRWSLTQILLSQPRFGMNNPVATMSKLTPIIGISMLLFSLILEHPFTEISKNKNVETAHDAVFIALMMIAGGVLAFSMVLSEFFLISRTSVVTLSIAGMLKEVVMVGVAHLVFGDKMTLVNASGLLVALFGIGMYNWLKIHDTLNSGGKQRHGSTDSISDTNDL